MTSMLSEIADEKLEKEAREVLRDKLREGEKVAGFDKYELLNCALSGIGSYDIYFPKVCKVLLSEYPETPLFQEKLWNELIEQHIEAHPEEVEQMIADMEYSAEEAAWR